MYSLHGNDRISSLRTNVVICKYDDTFMTTDEYIQGQYSASAQYQVGMIEGSSIEPEVINYEWDNETLKITFSENVESILPSGYETNLTIHSVSQFLSIPTVVPALEVASVSQSPTLWEITFEPNANLASIQIVLPANTIIDRNGNVNSSSTFLFDGLTDDNIAGEVARWKTYVEGGDDSIVTDRGDISTWDVSRVTNMSSLFSIMTTIDFFEPGFVTDVTNWDTSNVTDLTEMFAGCTLFDQDLSNWDTSKVTTFKGMFDSATSMGFYTNSLWGAAQADPAELFYNNGTGDLTLAQYQAASPLTDANIQTEVNRWMSYVDSSGVTEASILTEPLRGDISVWDVSRVTNMSSLFVNWATDFANPGFETDISTWNTSNVVNMNYMFSGCSNFDVNVNTKDAGGYNAWDVSQVTTFQYMFKNCEIFNQPLSNWQISPANKNFQYMFHSPYPSDSLFNQDLLTADVTVGSQSYRAWNMSEVTAVNNMFNGCTAFDGDISTWNTSKISNFNNFMSEQPWIGGIVFNKDISTHSVTVGADTYTAWDMSSATDCYAMLWGHKFLNGYIDNWDVSNVTDMGFMLRGCSVFNVDISGWDVRKVESTFCMFLGSPKFNQPIGSWVFDNLKDCGGMFYGASDFNQPVDSWNMSNVTNMYSMFQDASDFNHPLSSWDISKAHESSTARGLYRVFRGATSFNQDISMWDVSKISNMKETFYNASDFDQDLSAWDTSNVTIFENMFTGSDLDYYGHATWGASQADAAEVYYNGNMTLAQYQAVSPLTDANIVSQTTRWKSYVESNGGLEASILTEPFRGDISVWDVSKVTNFNGTFTMWGTFDWDKVGFETDISAWDVSNATNMDSMFAAWWEGGTFNNDLSNWDTSKVTSMGDMFADQYTFNQDISSWNVEKVTSMRNMFSIDYSFASSSSFDQDLSSWNPVLVNDVSNMFSNQYQMGLYGHTGWPTAGVNGLNYYFNGTLSYTLVQYQAV